MSSPLFDATVQVPCKALLFGEYGLLIGQPGLVYVSVARNFVVSLKVFAKEFEAKEHCQVVSDFFPDGTISFPLHPESGPSRGEQRDVDFFRSAIRPYPIQGWNLEFTLHRSYSPSYGLGSSSALLAAVHGLLDRVCDQFKREVQSTSLERILVSLKHQGSRGSGYDALCQKHALNSVFPKLLWVIVNPEAPEPVDEDLSALLCNWDQRKDARHLAVLDSQVYSNTLEVLAKQTNDPALWQEQGNLLLAWKALAFDLDALPSLMSASRDLCQRQGLFGQGIYRQKLDALIEKGVFAKSMGAGHGDGFFAFGTEAQLKKETVILSVESSSLPSHLQALQDKLFSLRLQEKLVLQPGDQGLASAPSNIALTKYWGKEPHALQIPLNSSLSFSLGGFRSLTKLECLSGTWPWAQWVESAQPLPHHQVCWESSPPEGMAKPESCQPLEGKLQRFVDLVLGKVFPDVSVRIRTFNNFPTACGIASSASGFAALTGAFSDLLGLERFFSAAEVQLWCTEWARIGSGSATRSALSFEPSQDLKKQFVAWDRVDSGSSSTSEFQVGKLFQQLESCVAVLNSSEKSTSSSEGHKSVASSPLFPLRLAQFPKRHHLLCQALLENRFEAVQEIVERDAFEMHALMQTSTPAANYFSPGTASLIADFVGQRNKGNAKCLWTLDAGPNVHFLFLESERAWLEGFFKEYSSQKGSLRVLWNQESQGLKTGALSPGNILDITYGA